MAQSDSDRLPLERIFLGSAWVVSLLTVGGSLFLSLGMGLKACPLCFYQRAFALSVAAVLTVALVGRLRESVGLLALPLATAGLGVASFHVWLEANGRLECPPGIAGLGSAPQQSLAAFVLLFALLLGGVRRNRDGRPLGLWDGVAALVVGCVAAVASCVANPPLPSPPAKPYDQPADVCRPPYPASPDR
jgi:disulfide bond formation protein DsbB